MHSLGSEQEQRAHKGWRQENEGSRGEEQKLRSIFPGDQNGESSALNKQLTISVFVSYGGLDETI